jgi:sulfate/thiosulfate transport system ATP-binding protein
MSIQVANVSKRFGDFVALDDVSLEVESGSLTALLGPSGSGKSTLLRIIAGLEWPDSGAITLSGQDATALRPQKRNVGFVFQHYAAFKHMTVRDNVAFGLQVRKRPKAEIRERVDELLKLVQLEAFGHRYPSQLSGGQRQRMALARALAPEPQVLLLDEPFGALDARVRAELREWLRRLHEEVHVTTIFVTHDQAEAMDVASEIAVMNHARIEQVGTPTELYDDPQTEFVMSFVGEANRLGAAWVRPHELEIVERPASDAVEAMIERITLYGFDARVELTPAEGDGLTVQLTRQVLEELELEQGQIVWVRAARERLFSSAKQDSAEAEPRGLIPASGGAHP